MIQHSSWWILRVVATPTPFAGRTGTSLLPIEDVVAAPPPAPSPPLSPRKGGAWAFDIEVEVEFEVAAPPILPSACPSFDSNPDNDDVETPPVPVLPPKAAPTGAPLLVIVGEEADDTIDPPLDPTAAEADEVVNECLVVAALLEAAAPRDDGGAEACAACGACCFCT